MDVCRDDGQEFVLERLCPQGKKEGERRRPVKI